MKEKGVLDTPFRLIIVLAVLVIVVPLVIGIVDRYSSTAGEQEMLSKVNYIKDKIIMVYSMGLNASLKIEVTFPGVTEYVRVGGPINSEECYFIRAKAYNFPERIIIVKYGNIGVRVTSNNTSMVLWRGTYRILITKAIASYDIDNNGLLDDFYVNLWVVKQ